MRPPPGVPERHGQARGRDQPAQRHERRFTGFDDKIIAMYARGMTVREVQGFLADQYGVEVSPEFISAITDAVMAEVGAWQARPLEPMYPVVFFDALRVKIREDAVVRNKAIYLALGVLPDGTRDILELWIEGTEGAKFWMKVFNDLKTRGVADMLIAVTDGLKGMPDMKTPPSKQELEALIAAMGMPVRDLLREKGTPYAVLKLDDPKWSDEELLDFILKHPILINRPIVVTPLGTKLCRPSEEVLEILPGPKLAPFTKEDGEMVVDDGRRRM